MRLRPLRRQAHKGHKGPKPPHRRHPVPTSLAKQQRKVRAQTGAIVRRLEHEASSAHGPSVDGAATAHSLGQLRATIADVRQTVGHTGAGLHTNLVKSALGDLERGLQTLSASFTATDPNTRLQMLAQAKSKLDRAHAKARRAGDDWPL